MLRLGGPRGLQCLLKHMRLPSWQLEFVSMISQSRSYAKQLAPRMKIDEGDIEEAFLKGSGPGGQKINKTNSAVQLKHLPTGIVVKCQETRSRTQNRKYARLLLEEKLDILKNGEQSRPAIKAAAKSKKKASADKKKRRKYRAAEGEKLQKEEEDEEGEAEVEAGEGNVKEPKI